MGVECFVMFRDVVKGRFNTYRQETDMLIASLAAKVLYAFINLILINANYSVAGVNYIIVQVTQMTEALQKQEIASMNDKVAMEEAIMNSNNYQFEHESMIQDKNLEIASLKAEV